MNYLSLKILKKMEKKVVSSLLPAPKQTFQNLNYFNTYASELPFLHSVPVPSLSLCRLASILLIPHTQKLSVHFLLKSSCTLLFPSSLVSYHFIHTGALYPLTIPPRCCCSTHSTIHTGLTFIITFLLRR